VCIYEGRGGGGLGGGETKGDAGLTGPGARREAVSKKLSASCSAMALSTIAYVCVYVCVYLCMYICV